MSKVGKITSRSLSPFLPVDRVEGRGPGKPGGIGESRKSGKSTTADTAASAFVAPSTVKNASADTVGRTRERANSEIMAAGIAHDARPRMDNIYRSDVYDGAVASTVGHVLAFPTTSPRSMRPQ